jgi:hypothetical protein
MKTIIVSILIYALIILGMSNPISGMIIAFTLGLEGIIGALACMTVK